MVFNPGVLQEIKANIQVSDKPIKQQRPTFNTEQYTN